MVTRGRTRAVHCFMSAAVKEPDVLDQSRTVVVSGVPDPLPGYRMAEKLTVHFQRRGVSHGGDVEAVTYPTNMKGVAFVTFDQAADAERVVQKEQQILTGSTSTEQYLLTVFPFTTDVFFYVTSANVDLSVFNGDQASLIRSLRSAHRSLRFQVLPHGKKATVEGPFAAIRVLREDLIHRATQLKLTLPTVRRREFPPNPRVESHRGFVGPVSCSDSKAKREAAGSHSLSAPLQSTGEGSEVQRQLSNAKAPESVRQEVQSLCDTGTDEEEELKAGFRCRPATERAQGKPTQQCREEMNTGVRCSLSGLHPAEKPSTRVNDVIQIHTRTARTRSHVDPYSRGTDYLKESHQRTSSEISDRNTQDLCAGGLHDPEDSYIWVDSYIFKYIERLDEMYKRCLRGVNASVDEVKGSDLVRICLTDEQPSEGPSRVQQALENLKTLVEHWQSTLRVHDICFNKKEFPKQKLMQICDAVKTKYENDDVLYTIEDSRIKVVGPSSSSYLFYIIVQKRLEWMKQL